MMNTRLKLQRVLESNNELIQIGKNSKFSLDLNNLQIEKNLKIDDLIKSSVSQKELISIYLIYTLK